MTFRRIVRSFLFLLIFAFSFNVFAGIVGHVIRDIREGASEVDWVQFCLVSAIMTVPLLVPLGLYILWLYAQLVPVAEGGMPFDPAQQARWHKIWFALSIVVALGMGVLEGILIATG